jgi:hypothetical protein
MSIISQLLAGKITWTQAVTEIDSWAEGLFAKTSPEFHTAIAAAVTDVKQGASDAISLADTLAGPLITTAAAAAGTAFTVAVNTYLGPAASAAVSPSAVDAIDKIRDGVIAELNTLALQAKAALVGVTANSAA